MGTVKHTPGEWTAKECPGGDIAIYGENQPRDIGLVRYSNPQRHADAALIAAAPMMAAALGIAHAALAESRGYAQSTTASTIRAALRAAGVLE